MDTIASGIGGACIIGGFVIGLGIAAMQYLYGKAQQSELGRKATQRLGEAAVDALKKKLGQ